MEEAGARLTCLATSRALGSTTEYDIGHPIKEYWKRGEVYNYTVCL